MGTVRHGNYATKVRMVQPFGNNLVVKRLTGAQLHALLEQQYDSGTNTVASPRILSPSAGFTYAYDLTRPAGERVSNVRLHGKPVSDDTTYHIAMNSFLASGGDNFTVFSRGTEVMDGALDIDALEAYLIANSPVSPAATDRITRIH